MRKSEYFKLKLKLIKSNHLLYYISGLKKLMTNNHKFFIFAREIYNDSRFKFKTQEEEK